MLQFANTFGFANPKIMPENTQPIERDKEVKPDRTTQKIRFHYIKSSAFRTIHADGVFGGVTPRLNISATFYNERGPLPDQTVQDVREDGTLGTEILEERIIRDGILRELEANIVMDVAVAKSLVKWLNEKIALIEKGLVETRQAEDGQSSTT